MDTEQTAPDPTPTPSTGPGESGYEERAALAEKFEARVRELLEAHFPSLENPTLKPYLEEVGRLQVEFGDSFGVFYQILELAVARVPVAALADRQALIEKSLTSVSKGLKALQKIHHIQSSGTPSSLEFRFALAETALRDPLWSTGAPSPLGGGGDLRNSWATPDQSRFLLAAAVRNGLNLNVLHQPPSDDEWELLVDGALKVRSSGFPLNNPLTRSRVKQLVPRGSLYLDAMDPGRAPWVNARSAEVEWRGFCSVDQSANDLERIARWAARWARTLVLSDGPDVQAAARARGLTMAAASRAGSEEERAGLLKLAQGDPPITNDSSSLTRVYDDTLARFVAAVAVPEKTGELLVDLRRLVKRAALAVPLEDLQNRLNFEEVDQAMGHVLAQVANGSRRRAATAARVINAEGWGISQLSESLWRVGRVVRPDLRDAERCADLAWGVRVAALARRSPEAAGWQVLMDAMDEAREQRPDRDTNRDTGRAISAAAHLFKSPLAPGREDPEGPPKREAVAALKALFAAAPGTYRKHVGHLGKLLKEWYPKWSEEDRAEVRKLHEAQFSGNPQPAAGAPAAEAPPLPRREYTHFQLSYANEAARASDVVLEVTHLHAAVERARLQWAAISSEERAASGAATPRTLSFFLAEADWSSDTSEKEVLDKAYQLMGAGDWRAEISDLLKRASFNPNPASVAATRTAVRAGVRIGLNESPDTHTQERWKIFGAAFEEVTGGGREPSGDELLTLWGLYEGPAGIQYQRKSHPHRWEDFEWSSFCAHLRSWAQLAPNSFANGAAHFSWELKAGTVPPEFRPRIEEVIASALNAAAAQLNPAEPAAGTGTREPRPSRLRKVASTAAGDAEEVALRLVVERARAELAARMVAWSAVRVGGGAAAARDHQAAFFASPAGRGLISYLLGLGWKAAQGHASWAPEGGLGDRIAREIRLQGGEDLVDGFYREVAAPLFERLSGVGETASTLVRIEATRPAAAAAGGSSEETQPGAERGLEAVAGRDATRSGP